MPKNDDYLTGTWENTISLTLAIPKNLNISPNKQYFKRNKKHVIRYGFEDN